MIAHKCSLLHRRRVTPRTHAVLFLNETYQIKSKMKKKKQSIVDKLIFRSMSNTVVQEFVDDNKITITDCSLD